MNYTQEKKLNRNTKAQVLYLPKTLNQLSEKIEKLKETINKELKETRRIMPHQIVSVKR